MKISVKIKTNARKNEVKKIDDINYEISTTATPANGQANKAIIDILAKFFRIGKTKINIISGHTSKNKIIEILQ